MLKMLCVMMFSFFVFLSYADEAVLKLDTGCHFGVIRKLIVTPHNEIITASYDKTIRVWDAETLKEKRKILGQTWNNGGEIYAIALSPDEKFLAVGGAFDDNEVRIYAYQSGKLIKTLKGHTKAVADLSFSDDGEYLVSGSVDKTAVIWKMSEYKKVKIITDYSGTVNAVLIKQEDNTHVIYSGSSDGKLYKHFINNDKFMVYEGYRQEILFIALNKNYIAVTGGNINAIAILDRDTLRESRERIMAKSQPAGLIFSPDDKYLLSGSSEYPYLVTLYEVENNFRPVVDYMEHWNVVGALGFINSNTIITAGGSLFELAKWSFGSIHKKILMKTPDFEMSIREGETKDIIKQLPVGSPIMKVSIEGNEITFCNYSNQPAELHIMCKEFDISNFERGVFGEGETYLDYITFTHYVNIYQEVAWNSYLFDSDVHGRIYAYGGFGRIDSHLIGHSARVSSLAVYGDKLVSGSADQTIKIWDLKRVLNGEKEINPMLTLFVGKNNEWIAWTDEGFFDASPEGAKLIGYHINRGADKEAEFVSVDKMYYAFYRPDLIRKALAGESLKKYADKINIDKILKDGLAPKVAILSAANKNNANTADLRLKVCDTGGGYSNLSFMINGTSVERDNSLSPIKTYQANEQTCYDFSKSVKLAAGNNIISFNASNKAGSIISDTASVSLDYRATETAKPTLYILSIAVDRYLENPLKYSKNDAKLVVRAFEKYAKGQYKDVVNVPLEDEDVTEKNIMAAFERIGKMTQRDDLFVLYVVGHGELDNGDGVNNTGGEYYFLPADFRKYDDDSLKEQGFGRDKFIKGLSMIQAINRLVFVDTCHSGDVATAADSDKGFEIRGGSDSTKFAREVNREAATDVIAATTREKFVKAGYNEHGALALAVADGIKKGATGSDCKYNLSSFRKDVSDNVIAITKQPNGEAQVPKSSRIKNDYALFDNCK